MIDDPKIKCWKCQDQIYTVLLWNKKLGWLHSSESDSITEEIVVQKIEERQASMRKLDDAGKVQHKDHRFCYNIELGSPGSSIRKPVLYASFTNWNPV